MTNWRTRWLLAPLTLAILLATAAAAAAAGTEVTMSLRGSHGYRLQVQSFAGELVQMAATKAVGDADVYANYTVRGKVTAKRVEANFGDIGRVSLRFQPAPSQPDGRPPSRSCKGRFVHLAGRFVGTIRFRGEQGFSTASATRARGSTTSACATESTRRPPRGDGARPSSRPPVFFETELVAATRSKGRVVSLDSESFAALGAVGKPTEPSASFTTVELEEDRGRLTVEKSAIIDGEPIAASPLGAVPVTASLALSAPFSGAGSYRADPGSPPSWTGDLSVDLPGAPDVPLAGPAFTSILCSGKSTSHEFDRCHDKAIDILVP